MYQNDNTRTHEYIYEMLHKNNLKKMNIALPCELNLIRMAACAS